LEYVDEKNSKDSEILKKNLRIEIMHTIFCMFNFLIMLIVVILKEKSIKNSGFIFNKSLKRICSYHQKYCRYNNSMHKTFKYFCLQVFVLQIFFD
jgi:hypothetical protein